MASEFVSDSLIATATANDTSRLIDVIDADPKVSMLGMVVELWTRPVHMGEGSSMHVQDAKTLERERERLAPADEWQDIGSCRRSSAETSGRIRSRCVYVAQSSLGRCST